MTAQSSLTVNNDVQKDLSHSREKAEPSTKLNWSKVDITVYHTKIDDIYRHRNERVDTQERILEEINLLHITLENAGMKAKPPGKKRCRIAKANIWNQKIAEAHKASKQTLYN
jgi:hypothetical protein